MIMMVMICYDDGLSPVRLMGKLNTLMCLNLAQAGKLAPCNKSLMQTLNGLRLGHALIEPSSDRLLGQGISPLSREDN